MGEHLVIRGLPEKLARDGWWFLEDAQDAATPPLRPRPDAASRRVPPATLATLAALIVLADGLFWDADLGISVALYALALTACMIALKPGGVTRREALIVLALSVISNLPVIEQVQFLSALFSIAGVVLILAWTTLGPTTQPGKILRAFVRATFIGTTCFPRDAVSDLRRTSAGINATALIRSVALPLVIGALFLVLFTLANPLLENTLSQITSIKIFTPEQLTRLVFWVAVACVLWPYLTPQGGWWKARPPKTRAPRRENTLINAGSVRSSLILFNVMFAVQTVSDLGILTGGMALPEGMTYAQYAHRGAYPLVVMAFMSGLFAMATRRMVADNKLLRTLMYVWLGQNLFLVLTAAFRLGLYVNAYTLTYMRVTAFIWMALTLIALVLVVVQMVQNRSMAWLVQSNAVALVATLYLCCFINFAYLITDYNMANTPPEALDLAYLCRLGEQAIPAMMEYGQITDQTACGRRDYPALRFDPIEDWQEWGFRRWRLQRYLETYHDL